eukprot:7260977-Pyramimonas_sp.AAC.1
MLVLPTPPQQVGSVLDSADLLGDTYQVKDTGRDDRCPVFSKGTEWGPQASRYLTKRCDD